MRKLLIPLVVGLTILVSQVVTGVSAQDFSAPDESIDAVTTPLAVITEPAVYDEINDVWVQVVRNAQTGEIIGTNTRTQPFDEDVPDSGSPEPSSSPTDPICQSNP